MLENPLYDGYNSWDNQIYLYFQREFVTWRQNTFLFYIKTTFYK